MSQERSGPVERMEHHQIAVYLGAMAAGALVGWAAPPFGPGLEHAINPVLGALLFVTFLQVPAAELVRSLRDGRFLSAALVVNFVVVPLVVTGMFVLLPADRAVRIGVLLVLLCPCVDYVIVFSGLAGGSGRRLLAATPLLLVAQMLLLPGFLYLFMGSALADIVETGPFVEAFVVLIVIPLALAWALQAWAALSARRAEGLRRRDHHDGPADGRHPLRRGRVPGPRARRQPRRRRRRHPVLRGFPDHHGLRRETGGPAVPSRHPGLPGGRFSGATRNSPAACPSRSPPTPCRSRRPCSSPRPS
ncbi:Arsenic resistance protein OS=Streptomyces microflavus OX=1919 GN=G3I39_21115 PE=3 SV=1 [Streptomyces microflavus]